MQYTYHSDCFKFLSPFPNNPPCLLRVYQEQNLIPMIFRDVLVIFEGLKQYFIMTATILRNTDSQKSTNSYRSRSRELATLTLKMGRHNCLMIDGMSSSSHVIRTNLRGGFFINANVARLFVRRICITRCMLEIEDHSRGKRDLKLEKKLEM